MRVWSGGAEARQGRAGRGEMRGEGGCAHRACRCRWGSSEGRLPSRWCCCRCPCPRGWPTASSAEKSSSRFARSSARTWCLPPPGGGVAPPTLAPSSLPRPGRWRLCAPGGLPTGSRRWVPAGRLALQRLPLSAVWRRPPFLTVFYCGAGLSGLSEDSVRCRRLSLQFVLGL